MLGTEDKPPMWASVGLRPVVGTTIDLRVLPPILSEREKLLMLSCWQYWDATSVPGSALSQLISARNLRHRPEALFALFRQFLQRLTLPRMCHFLDLVLPQLTPVRAPWADATRTLWTCHHIRASSHENGYPFQPRGSTTREASCDGTARCARHQTFPKQRPGGLRHPGAERQTRLPSRVHPNAWHCQPQSNAVPRTHGLLCSFLMPRPVRFESLRRDPVLTQFLP